MMNKHHIRHDNWLTFQPNSGSVFNRNLQVLGCIDCQRDLLGRIKNQSVMIYFTAFDIPGGSHIRFLHFNATSWSYRSSIEQYNLLGRIEVQ